MGLISRITGLFPRAPAPPAPERPSPIRDMDEMPQEYYDTAKWLAEGEGRRLTPSSPTYRVLSERGFSPEDLAGHTERFISGTRTIPAELTRAPNGDLYVVTESNREYRPNVNRIPREVVEARLKKPRFETTSWLGNHVLNEAHRDYDNLEVEEDAAKGVVTLTHPRSGYSLKVFHGMGVRDRETAAQKIAANMRDPFGKGLGVEAQLYHQGMPVTFPGEHERDLLGADRLIVGGTGPSMGFLDGFGRFVERKDFTDVLRSLNDSAHWNLGLRDYGTYPRYNPYEHRVRDPHGMPPRPHRPL